jgi:hypothetical protein
LLDKIILHASISNCLSAMKIRSCLILVKMKWKDYAGDVIKEFKRTAMTRSLEEVNEFINLQRVGYRGVANLRSSEFR